MTMDREIVESIERIFGASARESARSGPRQLSQLAIETNRDLSILQDQVDRTFRRATEKTLNQKMTE